MHMSDFLNDGARKAIFSPPLAPISSSAAFLSESCQTPAVSSSALQLPGHMIRARGSTPGSARLPVPVLMGKELMGVFSLLVLQRPAFIRMGNGYLDEPRKTSRNLQESNYVPENKKKRAEITLLRVLQRQLRSRLVYRG